MLTNQTTTVRYLISAGVSQYTITFGYWSKNDIKVFLTEEDGSITTLAHETDYSLTDPDGQGGTLTKVSDWGDATKLTIQRVVPLTQEKDFINGQVMDAEEIEESLDLLAAGLQQVNEAHTRTIKTPIDEEGADIVLPGKTQRQGSGNGTIMGFDGSGNIGVVRDLSQFDNDITQAHNDATSAGNSALAAAASEAKAQKWAEEAEDTPVETGKYSAKHHALKAAGSASAASTSETNAGISETNAGTSETNANNAKIAAQGAQTAAENARDKAQKWAEEDEDVPVETGKYSSKHYAEKASASATAAALSEGNAASSETKAEKWAEEAENTPVETGKYSAKHHALKAAGSASAASTSETNAGISETNAGNSAGAAAQSKDDAEAYAVGQRNGVDVLPGDPAYHNNAKYYSEQSGGFEPITDAEIDALFV